MAHYVMSDIHGEADRFSAMLKSIHFSSQDTLYILGDVIDRGPEGIALLRQIMQMPNAVMLLGNHEHMMLRYYSPDAEELEIKRWNKNGNDPTLQAFQALDGAAQWRILRFLMECPTHLTLEVGDRRFYLVHGFPGETAFDEMWQRPEADTPNPIPGTTLIIGHTKVISMMVPKEEREEYIEALLRRDEHLKILHAPGFLNLDCGCGYSLPVKKLSCLRLEDMAEFYV